MQTWPLVLCAFWPPSWITGHARLELGRGRRLAKHFGVSIDALVGEEEEPDANALQIERIHRGLKDLSERDRAVVEDTIRAMKTRTGSQGYKLQLSRIELADLHEPTAIYRAIFAQIGSIDAPVPVGQIARALGVAEIKAQVFDGLEGMLLTDTVRSTGSILANTRYGIGG